MGVARTVTIVLLVALITTLLSAAPSPFNVIGPVAGREWRIYDAYGAPLGPEYLFKSYTSTSVPYYLHPSIGLRGFARLRFEVYSRESTQIEFFVQDESGFTYRAARKLPGGRIVVLELHPQDFHSDPEETFLVRPLRGSDTDSRLIVYDAGSANALIPRRNRIVIHDIGVEKTEYPRYVGTIRVVKEFRLQSAWTIEGDIIVEKGGRLVLDGADIRLSGRIISFGGELVVQNSRIEFMPLESRALGITLHGGAVFRALQSRISSPLELAITADRGSRIQLADFAGQETLRFFIERSSRLEAAACRRLGEIRSDDESAVRLENVTGVFLWLRAGRGIRGEWSLPSAGRIADWEGGTRFRVSLRECAELTWGLRLFPGVEGYLSRGEFAGIEIVANGGVEADFSGLDEGKIPPGRTLQSEAYQLRFGPAVRVERWNIHVEEGSSAVIRNSRFSAASVAGRGSTLTIVNSTNGYEGSVVAELGGAALIESSRLAGGCVVATGGTLRILRSRLHGRLETENGGMLYIRDVQGANPVAKAPGGQTRGDILPLREDRPGGMDTVPTPGVSGLEMGGIGNFLPRISGFEEYENLIIPYFELILLGRFFIRFPEFQYVAWRSTSPRYTELSIKTAALFERVVDSLDKEVYTTPLSFEVIAAGSTRLSGPLWIEGEIAVDPSGQSYRGYRLLQLLRLKRRIPGYNLEADLYAGLQFANEEYIRSIYPGTSVLPDPIQEEYALFGGSLTRDLTSRWRVRVDAAVQHRVGAAAEYLPDEQNPFSWDLRLALTYRVR